MKEDELKSKEEQNLKEERQESIIKDKEIEIEKEYEKFEEAHINNETNNEINNNISNISNNKSNKVIDEDKKIEENIIKKLEEEKLEEKEKENEIQNQIIDEENQRKKMEEEMQQKILEEQNERMKIEEEMKQKILDEENERLKIEEEIKQRQLEEDLLKQKLEKENIENLNDEKLIKNFEENEKKEKEEEIKKEEKGVLENEKKEEGENKKEEEEQEEKEKKEQEEKAQKEKEEREKHYKNSHYIQNLKTDPKIGLNNIGATCYMNATIQCFSRTTYLSNYFLNPENETKFTENLKLSYSYHNLIKNLWNTQDNIIAYSPYDFKNVISEMNSLFKGIAANDSKDLILFILQQLHEELKVEINQDNNTKQNDDQIIDQTNRTVVLEEFLKTMKTNVSIISNLCFGVHEIISDCLNCRQKGTPIIKYNFQIFNFIIFPLKEVSNYKKNKSENINNVEPGEESVTLYDCFEQSMQPLIMTGDNMMFCNNCSQLSAASYTTKIYSAPNILILILNRGKGNEFKIKIKFEKIISIGNYVELKKEMELKYELYAVLTHLGSSDMSGHFVAFCYSIIEKDWYKFNDGLVDKVNDFQKEVHDFGEPYILFYQRMKE